MGVSPSTASDLSLPRFELDSPSPVPEDMALLLVPHISVTPEFRAVGDGRDSLWVAVEVTGQVCHAQSGQPAYPHFVEGMCCYGINGSLESGEPPV